MVIEGLARTVTYQAWLSGEPPESEDDQVRLGLFVLLSEAVEAVDPIGVVPDDDYGAEVAELVEALMEAGGVPEEPVLADLVVDVFERWFGDGSCSRTQALDIARRVISAVETATDDGS